MDNNHDQTQTKEKIVYIPKQYKPTNYYQIYIYINQQIH